MNCDKTLELLESFYDSCLENVVKEEDARYMKIQGTAFKAIISMNSHALLDWFKIRCCRNAQTEISDLAWKMLMLCKKAAPDIFIKAGPNCVATGFCTENSRQHPECKKAGVVTQEEAVKIVRGHRK
jgi:thymidylate synthase (FAD)